MLLPLTLALVLLFLLLAPCAAEVLRRKGG